MKQILIGLLVQTYENTTGIRTDYTYFASKLENILQRKVKVKVVHVTPDLSPEDIKLDLLILPGGEDLSVALQVGPYCSKQGKDDPSYSYFADYSLQEWVNAGVPIFGICLGMQMLVNFLGGKLTHHMDSHRLEGKHAIIFEKDDDLRIDENDWQWVNSRHHQGYMLSSYLNLSSKDKFLFDFKPLAFSVPKDVIDSYNTYKATDEQKRPMLKLMNDPTRQDLSRFPKGTVVEAFRHRTLKIAGVQWHPEELINDDLVTRGDEVTHSIIRWLLNDFKGGKAEARTAPLGMEGNEATVVG